MKRLKKQYQVIFVAILTVASTVFFADTAYAVCADDWLDVDEIRADDSIELRATNHQQFPITFTMRVRTRNMVAVGPQTVTETLDAEQSRLVMVLKDDGGDRKGNYRISCDWTIGDKDAAHDDDTLYRLPYATGKSYRVLQGYGSRFSHRGLEQFAVDFNPLTNTKDSAPLTDLAGNPRLVGSEVDRGAYEYQR